MIKKTSRKPAGVWVGVIPEIFGYGISVASDTKEGAAAALRRAYYDWKKTYPDPSTTFVSSFVKFGGRVFKVKLNKSYYDGFKS